MRHVLEDGELAVNQARTSERTPLVTMLLSGMLDVSYHLHVNKSPVNLIFFEYIILKVNKWAAVFEHLMD